MRTPIFVSLAALAAILTGAAPARLDSLRNPDADEISRLDECIQRRFLGMDTFGMSRVQYHGIGIFQPGNATEKAVVDRLQQKGYEVAFYLAGRGVLAKSAVPPDRRSGIQGPVFITPHHREFPRPDTLLADGRQALAAFQDGDGFDIQKAEWTVDMRPLRASKGACVQCHTIRGGSVQLGDPLGVAMYVYRRATNH
jgi:hypothetical protein